MQHAAVLLTVLGVSSEALSRTMKRMLLPVVIVFRALEPPDSEA